MCESRRNCSTRVRSLPCNTSRARCRRTIAAELWSEPVYERRLAAIVLLQRALDVLQGSDLTRVEQFLRDAHIPELVDPLAIDVVCPMLERLEEPDATRARRIIDRWSESDDPSLSRAAELLRA